MFENPRRGRQARNFTTNAPKILDLKSSSEQKFSRKLPLGAPELRELFWRKSLKHSGPSWEVSPLSRGKLDWIKDLWKNKILKNKTTSRQVKKLRKKSKAYKIGRRTLVCKFPLESMARYFPVAIFRIRNILVPKDCNSNFTAK